MYHYVLTSRSLEILSLTADRHRRTLGSSYVGLEIDKMANSLYNASEVEPWRETFELYEKILKIKAEREKKEKAVKLLELDNW